MAGGILHPSQWHSKGSLQKPLHLVVIPQHMKIETIGRFLEDDPLLKSPAAFIESVSQVAQSKTLVFVRKPERFANGVDQVADFLPLRFTHLPDNLKEIRIEVSL